MKYKIGIDFTYIIRDEVTGIRKYGEGLLDGFSKVNQDYEIVLFVNEQLKESFQKKFPNYKIISVRFFLKNVRYIRRINTLRLVKAVKNGPIRKEKCDLIIYPFVSKYVTVKKDHKKIITIQDIIPLDEIQDKNSIAYKKIKKENIDLMNETRFLLTISEYSKKRLLEIHPDYKGEIRVIPNSIEKIQETGKDVKEIVGGDQPYIFSINSFFKHKNQMTLVKAFELIKEKIPHQLVLVRKTRTKFAY